ncbi:MAG: DNA replication and repair protein RecF [Bacteroidales bacterium]|nr:DNA replication and repair protein RecF [Bacteroidales bacterium]
MYLESIRIANFKSHQEAAFNFNANINGIVGANGSGKTNLLDAIHYLSFCKSFFSSQDKYSVRFGSDFFSVHGVFRTFGSERSNSISCTYQMNGRKIMKANGKEYDRLSDHIGKYPLVMVSPYDHDIINAGSEVRRRFFDMIISQFDGEYLHQLISYQKIIMQRNTLLKSFLENRNYNSSLLDILNDQLIPLGNNIYSKRKIFIGELLPTLQSYYSQLSGNQEEINILYDSGLNEQSFEDGLNAASAVDAKCGFSTFGVHKDDYSFLINGNPIKRFGSQGQQKSFVLSTRLAQFDYIYSKKEIKPILLLDDIFDKLDKQRTAHLLDLVGNDHFGQVFLSDTDENRIHTILDSYNLENSIYKIEKNK